MLFVLKDSRTKLPPCKKPQADKKKPHVKNQRRKKIPGQKKTKATFFRKINLTYSQRLEDVDLFSVEGRLLRADVIKCWKIFHSKCGISTEDILVLALSGVTRGHRFKITHEIFSIDCIGGGHLL